MQATSWEESRTHADEGLARNVTTGSVSSAGDVTTDQVAVLAGPNLYPLDGREPGTDLRVGFHRLHDDRSGTVSNRLVRSRSNRLYPFPS